MSSGSPLPITSLERLSTCSICLSKQPLDEALAVIAAAGYKKVDLLGRMPHFSVDSEELSIDTLEEACRRHDIKIANIGTYFGQNLSQGSTPTEVQAEIESAERALAIAARLGSRSIRVQPGRDRSHETAYTLVPFFKEVSRLAEQHGINVGVETHGGITSDVEGMVVLCERVGAANFGVIYDPCNLEAVGVDYQAAYRGFREHIVHVHLKDGRSTADGWRRVVFNEGEIDMSWILRELETAGYPGDIALEYEVNDIEPPETGLVEWRRRYEGLVGRLK